MKIQCKIQEIQNYDPSLTLMRAQGQICWYIWNQRPWFSITSLYISHLVIELVVQYIHLLLGNIKPYTLTSTTVCTDLPVCVCTQLSPAVSRYLPVCPHVTF